MRKLRPFYSPEITRQMYAHTYDGARWPEHQERIRQTIIVAQRLIDDHKLTTVTDLSAGNGAIVGGLEDVVKRFSDISVAGNGIELEVLTAEPVDLWILTETIEHLEAPWTVLEQIARRTRWIVLSTPLDEDPKIGNYEHYWSFTQGDVADLLAQSGFTDATFDAITAPGWTYTYQLWTARGSYDA